MSAGLEQRDLELLEHVRRYRITVPEAVSTLPSFVATGKHAAKNVLRRLSGSGRYLKSAPLYRTRRYYHLTPKGARLLGEHESLGKPLTPDPLIRAYAILAFCKLQGRSHERLTPAEFEGHFPELVRRGQRTEYYIDSDESGHRLSYIRVDYGGQGRWDRLIARLRKDISKRCEAEAFRKLILSGEFSLTVLTALPQKAERLRQAVAGLEDPLPVPVRVELVPELLEMIAPPVSRSSEGN